MTNLDELNRGDKVRVSYEGTIVSDGSFESVEHGVPVEVASLKHRLAKANVEVEVLERRPQPPEVGQVYRSTEDSDFVFTITGPDSYYGHFASMHWTNQDSPGFMEQFTDPTRFERLA